MIKAIRPERVAEDKARRTLLREGILIRKLSHPHIVRCYEVVRTPDPLVILETVTGATLSHAIETNPSLELDDLAILGLHLCSAIGYLHRHTSFLHLDLKPSNVIAEQGRAKLIDFSHARRSGSGHRGKGTRQYLAPEQALGHRVTQATDVWGIGAVLFEAATGRRPFESCENGDYQQLTRPAASVRRYRRLPLEFTGAVDGCMETDPRNRPRVRELAKILNGLVNVA